MFPTICCCWEIELAQNEKVILKIVCTRKKRWFLLSTKKIKTFYNFIHKILIASFCFTTQNSKVRSKRTQDALILRMWVSLIPGNAFPLRTCLSKNVSQHLCTNRRSASVVFFSLCVAFCVWGHLNKGAYHWSIKVPYAHNHLTKK